MNTEDVPRDDAGNRIATHADWQAEPLVGSREACELLGGINRSTLARWVDSGRIVPVQKLPGATGGFLFTRAEVARVRAGVSA